MNEFKNKYANHAHNTGMSSITNSCNSLKNLVDSHNDITALSQDLLFERKDLQARARKARKYVRELQASGLIPKHCGIDIVRILDGKDS